MYLSVIAAKIAISRDKTLVLQFYLHAPLAQFRV
jgi:hypothetical protein